MKKRIVSFVLVLCMIVPLLPGYAFGAEEVTGDFMQKVSQITEEDTIPADYFAIYNEEDLRAIEDDPAGNYILMADIALSSYGVNALCSVRKPFTGVLEGNGHTISGINFDSSVDIYGTSPWYWGLFSAIDGARISNLKISGDFYLDLSSETGGKNRYYYFGGLAGKASGDVYISNCVNDVEIYFVTESSMIHSWAGGLIGYYTSESGNCTIQHCRNIADISSVAYVGGVVGYAYTKTGNITVSNCRNEGNITGMDRWDHDSICQIGGIAGYLEVYEGVSEVSACLNSGNISGGSCIGGIVGGSAALISSCANTGNVTGYYYIGGISGSGAELIQDCLNKGNITAKTATYFCGGIAGTVAGVLDYETILRCINIGSVTGSGYASAISTPSCETEEIAENLIVDCYWLDDGKTTTLYSACCYGGIIEGTQKIRTEGKLSAGELAKEESFENFDFVETWYMDEELGHPYPVALLNAAMTDTYKAAYIQQTNGFFTDDGHYEVLMAGSGDGSFAGILGDQYDRAGLDKANGIWEGVEYIGDLLEYKIPTTTDYDMLLADLLGGAISRDIREDHIVSNTLSSMSTMLTKVSAALDPKFIAGLKKVLKEAATATNLSDDVIKKVLDVAETVGLSATSLGQFGEYMGAVGSVVSIGEAGAAGCENVWDAFQFYVLCNANALTVNTYGSLFMDVAEQARKINSTEGGELYLSTQEFVSTMNSNLNQEPTAMYQATGESIGNLLTVGGGTLLETALKLTTLNPVMDFLSTLKAGFVIGVAVGNEVTGMDDIAYYGHMMEMCEVFAKGLHAEVLERKEAFEKSQSYEDAQALNLAAELYLNVQILACDYAYGYSYAIASSDLSQDNGVNKDDLQACYDLTALKGELIYLREFSQKVFIGEDGAINGFIANCPVIVEVTDSKGNVISRMETGNATAAELYGGSYLLLGEDGEHKAGIYDPDEHTVTITGEADGTMDLVVYSARDGEITRIDTYLDVPIREGVSYVITPDGLDGKMDIQPTKTEDYDPETHVHDYTVSVTAPTCTEKGCTTYTCYCGDSYEETTVDALGHSFADGVCVVCGAEEGNAVVRLAGVNRFETAFLVADAMKEEMGVEKFEAIIVSSGTNFPDALSGSYLSAVKNAPILLSFNDKYNNMAKDYIQENLAPGGTVYLLGGEDVVPESLAEGLTGFTVKRLAGDNRFDTNLEVLKEAGVGDKPILVCTGLSFADSLSASASELPILLVWKDLTKGQKEFLASLGGDEFYIIGGESAVSIGMEKQVAAYGDVTRIGGGNRFETSVLIAEEFFEDPDSAVLAYGLNFPDGLCGGGLAAVLDAPLILTMDKFEAAAEQYVQAEGIGGGYVLGSGELVSDGAVRTIFDLPWDAEISQK